ncbi:MAG: hypothetical protein LUQ65_02105 [Candidatus Helarchaeota archaeon]|nr:hypothetical protein [Candidatus Helarchaeota archaeon]
MQTKRDSIKEALTNMAIGFIIYLIAQLIVFPIVGIQSTFYQNLQVNLAMTIISFTKYFIVRRWFNGNEE